VPRRSMAWRVARLDLNGGASGSNYSQQACHLGAQPQVIDLKEKMRNPAAPGSGIPEIRNAQLRRFGRPDGPKPRYLWSLGRIRAPITARERPDGPGRGPDSGIPCTTCYAGWWP